MKKMSILFTVLVAIALLPINATPPIDSERSNKISFGIKTGINMPSIGGDYKDALQKSGLKTKFKTGFHIGGVLNIYLNKWMYLQPGLSLSFKGTKFEGRTMQEERIKEINSVGTPVYLQVPVLMSNRFSIGDNSKWQLNYGFYMAYGLGGKVTQNTLVASQGYWSEKKIDFFGNSEDSFGFKRFDAGIVLGTGFSISKFYLGLQYEMGLVNVAHKDHWARIHEEGTSFKIQNFTINAGFNL